MKSFVYLFLAIILSLVLTPVIIKNPAPEPADTTCISSLVETTKKDDSKPSGEVSQEEISVYLIAEKKVITVSALEYVCGAVAAEMPASYHEEALKAQAIACYTNAIRLKKEASQGGENTAVSGAHISNDSSVHQGYLTKAQRQEKWGDSFEKYEKRINDAVSDVLGYKLTYKGELCVAAFHAISTGNTENAQTVWGTNIDYLKSAKSTGDTLSPSYITTVSLTKEQFCEIASSLGANVDKNDNSTWLGQVETSDCKTVLSIEIGGKTFTGTQIRNAYSLKSAAFTAQITQTGVTFKVYGYGHAVGMSQYGADYMATQGSNYKEILKHYYKGAEITE